MRQGRDLECKNQAKRQERKGNYRLSKKLEIDVFTFDRLGDEAKETALEQYRDIYVDYDRCNCFYDM